MPLALCSGKYVSCSVGTLILFLLTVAVASFGATVSDFPVRKSTISNQAGAAYAGLPSRFAPNRGQANNRVAFSTGGLNPAVAFTSSEVVLRVSNTTHLSSDAVFFLRFLNANPLARIKGLNELPGKDNYFIGKDAAKWITQVPTFATVKYAGVYPGIDIRFHGRGSHLEYDFDIAPGADPREIGIKFDANAKLRLTSSGDLLVEEGGMEMRQHPPHAYQKINDVRKEIAAHAALGSGNEVRFVLAAYDHKRALVIDPAIVYEAQVEAAPQAIAVDSAGEIFLTGSPASDFLPTPGAFQTRNAGGGTALS